MDKNKDTISQRSQKMRTWVKKEYEYSQKGSPDCKLIEEKLKNLADDLSERVKEMNCLYNLSHLIEDPVLSLEEILQETVCLIPSGCRCPEIICARIMVKDCEFKTKNYKETHCKLTLNIIVHGQIFGVMEVCYLKEKTQGNQEHFLKEERRLINAIAERLGRIIERKQAEETLQKYRNQLEELVDERTSELLTANKQLQEEITKHKSTELALQESEEKYSTLVEQAMDGVAVVQGERYIFVNKAMTEITGYSTEELIGKHFLDIVAPENRNLIAQRCALHMAGQRAPSFYETKIQGKDGTLKDVELSAAIIKYKGNPADTFIIRDVTERKKIEEEIQKAQKFEVLGVLAGGIAHDFNNILVTIIGSFSLLRLYAQPGDALSEILDMAEKATSLAKNLTRQLLTFSKGEALVKKTASTSELLQDTSTFILRGSKVKCEFFLSDNLWPVEVDTMQISQVINNLIINACQAMPDGGIIKVSAENVTVSTNTDLSDLSMGEGKYVKICIKDQGIGIPQQDLHKIFYPYFTTKEEGSGLGLANCFSIIKKHGGYITVDSEVGLGSTFHIYLPSSEREILAVKKIEEETIHFGEGKILVMDDQENVKDMVRQMLIYLGYEVHFASDGAEAIKLFQKAKEAGQPFNAVILDLTVPGGMGAQEAIQELLAIDPEVRAIVSSGYDNDSFMSNYSQYGFCGAIVKPFEIKGLSEILNKATKMCIEVKKVEKGLA